MKDWQDKNSARVVAGVAVLAALLLIGGGYAFLRHTVEKGMQQAELKWEEQRKAIETEANSKVAEAEQQRLAALKALKLEEERRAKAEAEAEAKRKADAEQRRLADLKAEQERMAKTLPAPSLFTIQRDVEASATGGARNESLYSRSIGECEQTCAQRPTCNVFTYAKSIGAGACYLYTRAELKPNAGFDSGIRK